MNIERILRQPEFRIRQKEEIESIDIYFLSKKESFVGQNDEANANFIAIQHIIFNVQNDYIKTYELLSNQEYYTAWCLLERIEIAIKGILRHYTFIEDEYKVLFIKEYTYRLQKLFPYKYFASSEYVKLETRCSICDSVITLRKRCPHKKGQLYTGQMCSHLITKSDFIGVALVTTPFNKYSVLNISYDNNGKAIDPYKYPQIDFLLSIIDHPFNEWDTEEYKILEDHNKYRAGRNGDCPCGSELKYKRCCLKKSGVEINHTEFLLKYPTMKSRGITPTSKMNLIRP